MGSVVSSKKQPAPTQFQKEELIIENTSRGYIKLTEDQEKSLEVETQFRTLCTLISYPKSYVIDGLLKAEEKCG
jgi:hypothetical protein